MNWRDHLPIHPAAQLFPLMSEAELKVLAEDIRVNGLQTPIVIWETDDEKYLALVDGRNRLDALELLGLLYVNDVGVICQNKQWNGHEWLHGAADCLNARYCEFDDPYAAALSFNLNRRHLTPQQKRELIVKVLKAKPEASNRQIAEQVKANHKTVGTVRESLESRGEIPHVEKRTDSNGREQPAKKSKPSKVSVDVPVDTEPTPTTADPDIAETPKIEEEEKRTERAPKENISFATRLDQHLSAIWEALQGESVWPPLNAARRKRRAKALAQYRKAWEQLVELLKPARGRGRPRKAEAERTGAEA